MRNRPSCAAFVVLMTIATAATSQSAAQNASAPQAIDPKACTDQLRLQPRIGADPQQPTSSTNQTLSEKLERSEGVICPPLGVDPEIAAPPPGGGKTPVIPPPGSPGGDPSIRPK